MNYALTRTGLIHRLSDPVTTACGQSMADGQDIVEMQRVTDDWAEEWLAKNSHDLCRNCREVAT